MIPVKPKLAPKGFHRRVFRPGRDWLLAQTKIPRKGPIPKGIKKKLPAYWRRCLRALHRKYDGICAYLCIYFELPASGHSVDHFVPKSRDVALAYRWSNYRLSSLGSNTKKRDYTDVLDPFTIDDETFYINFFNGKITPNPALAPGVLAKAKATIKRLKLDSYDCRRMRLGHYDEYRRGVPLASLERRSPFVWREIVRQGL
jgi:uncharacterized protein (TIGR02646 family)